MRTIRHNQPGYFSTPPGMCFTKPDMPMTDGTHLNVPNRHPFIILNENDDMVECVMAKTLYCEREGKDLTRKLKYAEHIELNNPHPPMESAETRRQFVDTSTTFIVPKHILYESTDIRICADGGWRLNDEDLKSLRKNVNIQAQNSRWSKQLDPYDYEEIPYPIDEFLPRNGFDAVSIQTPNNTHEGLSQ